MKTTKKAARIGGDQLAAGIAAASANAKSRVQKLSGQEADGVSGGVSAITNVVDSIIDIGGTTTQGMAPPDDGPTDGGSFPFGTDD